MTDEEIELLKFLVKWHMHRHILNPELRERFDFVKEYSKDTPEQVAQSSNHWKRLLLILNETDAVSTNIEKDEKKGIFHPAPFNRGTMYEIYGVNLSPSESLVASFPSKQALSTV